MDTLIVMKALCKFHRNAREMIKFCSAMKIGLLEVALE